MSNPVPGLPSGMSWVRVWVLSLGYPFCDSDRERNSSDSVRAIRDGLPTI